MTGLKPDKSTPENVAYWEFVKRTAREVRGWPDWKQPTSAAADRSMADQRS
jgi:hypothetical protein